jgi:hypothetical protein
MTVFGERPGSRKAGESHDWINPVGTGIGRRQRWPILPDDQALLPEAKEF